MLEVSPTVMTALDAEADRKTRDRFFEWWRRHGSTLGRQSPEWTSAIYAQHLPEALFAGLDVDEEIFPFVAGRALIPNCEGEAYEALLNLICDDDVDGATCVAMIARRAAGRA